MSPDGDSPETPAPADSNNRLLPKLKKRITKKRLVLAIFIIFLFSLGATFHYVPQLHFLKNYHGSSECISWAKKIEGKNISGVHTLDCKLSPKTIGNSNLKAQYLEYSGAPRDKEVCNVIDPGFSPGSLPPDYKYCTGWWGIVLSNGRSYSGLGDIQNGTPDLLSYDHCYSNSYASYAPKASIHDLYIYQNDLYERDVFNNVKSDNPFGRCTLNGTTIYRYLSDSNVHYTTNVKVDYKGFPNDCRDASIGKSFEQYQQCVDLVTAAHATLDACYSNIWPKPSKNNVITRYETQKLVYWGQSIWGDCESVYVQRMAALNRCAEITIEKLRDLCGPLVNHPDQFTTRIASKI